MAITKIKSQTRSLVDIGQRLAAMGTAELEQLVHPPAAAAPAPSPEPTLPAESWKRVILCPGLELHVADTAMHKRLAQQVYEDFVARQKG